MQLLLVAMLVGLASSGVMQSSSESDDQLWNAFKIEHSKEYSSSEEESRRKLIFLDNLQFIQDHNEKYEDGQVSYALGTNQLSDLTKEEVFNNWFGYDPMRPRQSSPTAFFSSPANSDVPDKIDWREKNAVTEVKDQGACASCWAFSATGSLEGLHSIKTGKLVSLSEQDLVDCSKKNGGCRGGYPSEAFDDINQNGGIDTETSYPYIAEESGRCKYNRKEVGATDKGYHQVPVGDEQQLKVAVATIGPISVGIDASHPSFYSYKKGIYTEPHCKSDMPHLHHAVLVVGYGTTDKGEDYWLIKNSWGTSWGMDGYAMFPRNKDNHCGIATDATYPII